jgi:hypothetical protein
MVNSGKMMNTNVSPAYDQFLDYLIEKATPEEILAYQISDAEKERAEYLLDQNNEGELTPEERAELQQMLQLNRLISLLKAKAAYIRSQSK